MNVQVHARTDIGLRRSQNEDHLAWWMSDAGGADSRAVLVVADGMGGARAGEVASQIAADFVLAGGRDLGSAASPDDLRRIVESANHIVHQESIANPEHHGMGTTCTAMIVREREALFAHVGDSRAYLIHAGTIRQLTRDHSLVAQLVEFHHLTPEEAKVDPRRNVVTRSLGVGPTVEVDTGMTSVENGDTLLLSSDGLHGLVEDDELLAHASDSDLDRACGALVDLAKARGGHDNITVILARIVARA